MKKLATLLLLAFTAVTFSCNKKEKAQTQPYAINGVKDMKVRQGEDDSWNLEIRSIGPVYETVTLDITGLPIGITANMSNKTGIPTFFSTVVFSNTNALPGSYPCILTASSPEAGKSTYNFMLRIDAPIICGLLQAYNATSDCDTNDFISQIVANNPPIEDSINTVTINNLGNEGLNVEANIDCSTSSIDIPAQNFGPNISISGSGTFTGGAVITINYTIVINGTPTPCITTMIPQ